MSTNMNDEALEKCKLHQERLVITAFNNLLDQYDQKIVEENDQNVYPEEQLDREFEVFIDSNLEREYYKLVEMEWQKQVAKSDKKRKNFLRMYSLDTDSYAFDGKFVPHTKSTLSHLAEENGCVFRVPSA